MRFALRRSPLLRFAPEDCTVKVFPDEIRAHRWLALPSLIPLLDPLLEDFEMFRVRHGRVTSLASALLRMILTACFEGHTLCDPRRPVNAQTSQRFESGLQCRDGISSGARTPEPALAGGVRIAQHAAAGGVLGSQDI